MQKLMLSYILFLCTIAHSYAQKVTITSNREEWLSYLDKIAKPVLENLANDQLREKMPVVLSEKVDNKIERNKAAYLEAFARTLSGIAPWLQLDSGTSAEINMRNGYRQLALKSLSNAVNPSAKDYMNWNGGQPLVDASFLALALVRCPWLWQHSDSVVKNNIQKAFVNTRNTVPVYSNWLLFTAMIETFFCQYDLPYDKVRIDFALKEFSNHWYTGDGMYSDGNHFHMDYYNSYVIQPYLHCIVSIMNKKANVYKTYTATLSKINGRYATLQERMINADGSFPIIGRSITYRGGAFHHLANMALLQQLPSNLPASQIRSALTAVLRKTLDAPNTFNEKGWLNIGIIGLQPNLAEGYINTGSLYLCSAIFLPLGLSPSNEFWTKPDLPWTAVKVWSGQNVDADHAMDLDNEK